jgi:hypothetical protein
MGKKSTSTARRAGAAGAAGAVALGAAGYLRRRRDDGAKSSYAVVINLPEEKLRPQGAHLTPPLERVAEHADVTLRRPPNGRGTQVLATARRPGVDVRQRLREAKQQLETSEALRVESWPAARGRIGQWLTRRADRKLVRGGWR